MKKMNDKQRKIFKVSLLLVCALLLAITGVISFAVHQNQLAQKGDIFDKIVAEQLMTWVSPVLVLLIGIGVTAAVLSIGLWQVYKTPPHRKS
jgi:hypothetical protein